MVLFGDRVTVVEAPAVVSGGQTQIDRMRSWLDAWDLFLSSRKAEKTRTAYKKAWQNLMAYTNKPFWEIDRADLFAWTAEMKTAGLADATIQQRVAAISAFYQYVMDEYDVVDAEGRTSPLFNRNPAASKSLRPAVQAFSNVTALRGDQVKALLRAINLRTVQGLRDFALFTFYLSTGRRNTEIRVVRKGDFRQSGVTVQYRWSGKRKDGWDECTPDVWNNIQVYLAAAGRPWETLGEGEYIFTALNDRAGRLHNVDAETYNPSGQPLSMRQVGALLKKYARRAGLDAQAIHVHVLRHTVAMLMDEAGFSLREIQERLKHSSLDMTNRYMDRLKGQRNDYWVKASALHDLPTQPFQRKK
jgi:site-specific recombinase XerD